MAENLSFYSLNGKIEGDELARRFIGMKSLGFDHFVLQARGGLEIPYLSREWFDALRRAIELGGKCGIRFTVYDEEGWPSGFAGGRIAALGREYHAKFLCAGESKPDGVERLPIAAYRKKGEEYELSSSGEGDLYVWYETDEKYVDLLDGETVEKFIFFVYEKYAEELGEFFGKEIAAFFTDEPAIPLRRPFFLPWSREMEEGFARCHGRRPLPELWKLFRPCKDARKFRYEYCTAAARLFFDNFTRRIASWCERHGVKWTGHLSLEDSVCSSFRANGSPMYNYKYFQQPGVDFLGNRVPSPVLMKQAVSVAEQYGKKQILSECFGGAGYGASLGDLEYVWNYHAAYGVNTPCLHLSVYSTEGRRKRDWPQFYSEQMNGEENISALLGKMRRANEFVSRGAGTAEVLVIPPLLSCYLHTRHSEEAYALAGDFRTLLEHLDSAEVQYDLGDEFLLAEDGAAEGNALSLARKRYTLVILARAENIAASTFRLLREYVRGGGKILVADSAPALVDGEESPEAQAFFAEIAEDALFVGRLRIVEAIFSYRFPEYRRVRAAERLSGKTARGVMLNVREDGNDLLAFAFNRDRTGACDFDLCFAERGRVCRVEGEREIPVDCAPDEDGVYAPVRLGAGEAAAFVLKRGEEPVRIPRRRAVTAELLPLSARLTDPNVLVLDRVRFSLGGEWSDETTALEATDRIYEEVNKGREARKVVLRYRFRSAFAFRGEIAAEIRRADFARLNGTELRPAGRWMDESVSLCPADVQEGENVLEIGFTVPPHAVTFGADAEEAETEKNRFCYPVEFENAYVRGAFSVSGADTEARRYRLSRGEFSVAPPRPLDPALDLAGQGAPFYRGAVRYEYAFSAPEGLAAARLFVERFNASALRVEVNGASAGVLLTSADRADILPLLRAGENRVAVELVTKDRNLFGPFHFAHGDTSIVGPSSFEGKAMGLGEWVDFKREPERVFRPEYVFEKAFLDGVRVEFEFDA